MKPFARNASTLAALLLLPLLQALCPRLAPDVISGKVIPCRYLCIKINFFELPSIVLGTEKDGVLCSTLLLRRRGVCKNGGCIPFGTDEEIKPKGTFGKVILAIDKFASGSFRKKAPEPGTPFGPIVTTAASIIGGGSGSTTAEESETASNPIASAAAGVLAKKMGAALKIMFSGKRSGGGKTESPDAGTPSADVPSEQSNANAAATSGRAVAVDFGGGPPIVPPSVSKTPAQEPNVDAATSDTRAVAVDFPPIVPPSVSKTPTQEPNADAATSDTRAVPVEFPPIVPASTEGGENSDPSVSGTPRGASASGTTPVSGPGSSVRDPDFSPSSAGKSAPSSDTFFKRGTPSQTPTFPPAAAEPSQGNSEAPAAGPGTSPAPGIKAEPGSSTVPGGSQSNGSPGVRNEGSGSSSNQPKTTRSGYRFGDFASSIGSGARSVTRSLFF